MSSRKNIRNDPIAANRSVCCNIRFHGAVVDWLARSESSLRKSGCWSESNSGLHSSLHDNYSCQSGRPGPFRPDSNGLRALSGQAKKPG